MKLDAPAPLIYLRYAGEPGVNNLRIYRHAVEEQLAAESPVVVTHTWKEVGELKSQAVELPEPGPYEIATQAEPINVSIEMAIPSEKR